MVQKEAIDAALSAHAQWRKRLQEAINDGHSQFDPATVRKDNVCQFGEWLYGLPEEDTLSGDFTTVVSLHATFHQIAADILELALAGKKNEALKKLETGGEYGRATGKLVLAMGAWKDKL